MRRLTKEERAKSKAQVETIDRKYIIMLLYKPLIQIKEIGEEKLNKLITQYPQIGIIYNVITEFKAILLNKGIDKLDLWIEKARQLNLPEINSFIIGITRDLNAVKNSIIYEYSNGLAEGKVNKLKVLKRIMYGPNNFEMLRKKILLLENS